MPVALQLAAFFATALVTLTYGGFWAARLLLPPAHRGYLLLAAPLFGFCTLAIGASWLNSTVLGMRAATPGLLLAMAPLNLLALRATPWAVLRRQEGRAVWPLLALVFAVGSAPMVLAQSTAFVGLQWDLELYLPLTEYLKQAPAAPYITGLDSPLLTSMNAADFRGGSGWGFSWVEAVYGVLLDWYSYQTFRPALQLAFALGAPAVYLTARLLFRAQVSVAWLAAALWAANGFNLWIASSGLAGHAVSFFLLPLAVTLTVEAARRQTARAGLAAGVALSGMLLSYYTGALLVWAGLSAAMVAPMLWSRRIRTRRLLRTGLVALAAVGGLAIVGHLRFLEVAPLYASQGFSSGWGATRYTPMAQALGLAPDPLVSGVGGPRAALGAPLAFVLDVLSARVALALQAAVGLASLTAGWHRSRFFAAALGFGGLLLAMAWVFPYPYGYFKVASLGGFILSSGVAQVAVAGLRQPGRLQRALALPLRLWRGRRTPGRLPTGTTAGRWRWVTGGVLALATGLLLLNSYFTLEFFRLSRGQHADSLWQLRELKGVLAPGDTVFVMPTIELTAQESALVAYFLLDNRMIGGIRTSYGALARAVAPTDADYVLATRQAEVPAEVQRMPVVWRNDLVVLYQVRPAPAR